MIKPPNKITVWDAPYVASHILNIMFRNLDIGE